jgi:hypothetical protein
MEFIRLDDGTILNLEQVTTLTKAQEYSFAYLSSGDSVGLSKRDYERILKLVLSN